VVIAGWYIHTALQSEVLYADDYERPHAAQV